jgi:hypothetical protein
VVGGAAEPEHWLVEREPLAARHLAEQAVVGRRDPLAYGHPDAPLVGGIRRG